VKGGGAAGERHRVLSSGTPPFAGGAWDLPASHSGCSEVRVNRELTPEFPQERLLDVAVDCAPKRWWLRR
jgi:hypothetical protein